MAALGLYKSLGLNFGGFRECIFIAELNVMSSLQAFGKGKFKLIVSLNISNIFIFHSPLTFVMPVFRSFANDL